MGRLQNRLLKKRNQLTDLEKQVLDHLLAHTDEVMQMTAGQLAEEMFISTATISRTAQHLGFKGFQELKYFFSQQTQGVQHKSEVQLSDSLKKLEHSFENQLHQTFEQLERRSLNDIVKEIKAAETIELLGVGGSLACCIQSARKLTFLGKKANARIDWDELEAVSTSLTPADFAIIVSTSGETPHVLKYAQNLKKRGVSFLALVGTTGSQLEQLATYTLLATVEMIYLADIDLSSRISFAAVLDLILIKFAKSIEE